MGKRGGQRRPVNHNKAARLIQGLQADQEAEHWKSTFEAVVARIKEAPEMLWSVKAVLDAGIDISSEVFPRCTRRVKHMAMKDIIATLVALRPDLTRTSLQEADNDDMRHCMMYAIGLSSEAKLPTREKDIWFEWAKENSKQFGNRLRDVSFDQAIDWNTLGHYEFVTGADEITSIRHKSSGQEQTLPLGIRFAAASMDEWSIESNWDEQAANIKGPDADVTVSVWGRFKNSVTKEEPKVTVEQIEARMDLELSKTEASAETPTTPKAKGTAVAARGPLLTPPPPSSAPRAPPPPPAGSGAQSLA